MNNTDALSQEWLALQDQAERYESGGLHIKLVAIALTVLGLATALAATWLCGVIALLWLQEGIYRTSQARLGQRLLRLEGLIKQGPTLAQQAASDRPCQLHSEWLAQRPGTVGLIREYVATACRPTVAYPYAPILLVLAVWSAVKCVHG